MVLANTLLRFRFRAFVFSPWAVAVWAVTAAVVAVGGDGDGDGGRAGRRL